MSEVSERMGYPGSDEVRAAVARYRGWLLRRLAAEGRLLAGYEGVGKDGGVVPFWDRGDAGDRRVDGDLPSVPLSERGFGVRE